jgi:hypothetical protein
MTFPVPGGATFLRARANLADVANAATALADLGSPGLVASTGIAGFNLQNATPGILTWNVPNDGALHRFMLTAIQHVTVAETGGAVTFSFTAPDGTAVNGVSAFAGGGGTGISAATTDRLVQAGTTVTLVQASALTAGAAILWAQIWGI